MPKRNTLEISESTWKSHILRLARQCGWRAYSARYSLGCDPGWPDLILCRPPRIIAVELKSDKGRVRPEQDEWLAVLEACGVKSYIWRPRDIEHVMEVLR